MNLPRVRTAICQPTYRVTPNHSDDDDSDDDDSDGGDSDDDDDDSDDDDSDKQNYIIVAPTNPPLYGPSTHTSYWSILGHHHTFQACKRGTKKCVIS